MTTDQLKAEAVAEKTREALRAKEWCLWRTKALGLIIIVKDGLEDTYDADKAISAYLRKADPEREGWPPYYTETELHHTLDMDDQTLRMVGIAKQHGRVTIMGVEKQR